MITILRERRSEQVVPIMIPDSLISMPFYVGLISGTGAGSILYTESHLGDGKQVTVAVWLVGTTRGAQFTKSEKVWTSLATLSL